MPTVSTLTQEEVDARIGRRVRELVCELGLPVYVPPADSEHGTIQLITLEDMLEIDPDAVDFAGEFSPVSDDGNGQT